MDSNDRKLRELVLYIAKCCQQDPGFGRAKLSRLLYVIDAFAYAELGAPITGAEYVKQKHGPAPGRLPALLAGMVASQEIVERERVSAGKRQVRLSATRDADLSLFRPDEVAFIDRVLDRCSGRSGASLTNLTHQWRGWRVARNIGDTIPYPAIFLSDAPASAYELEHAEELISAHGWDV